MSQVTQPVSGGAGIQTGLMGSTAIYSTTRLCYHLSCSKKGPAGYKIAACGPNIFLVTSQLTGLSPRGSIWHLGGSRGARELSLSWRKKASQAVHQEAEMTADSAFQMTRPEKTNK